MEVARQLKFILVRGVVKNFPSQKKQCFDELEKLGIRDPWNESIPNKYQTDEWYKMTIENQKKKPGVNRVSDLKTRLFFFGLYQNRCEC